MNTRSYEEVIASDPESVTAKPTVASFPEEFSWIDFEGSDWTTSVKRQKCGDCWLFGAIGCLESIINIREDCPDLDPDLSEQYVLSCYPKAGSCQGGWSYRAFEYMQDDSWDGRYHNGALLEPCFRYVGIDSDGCDYTNCNHDPVYCSEKCEDWENYLVPLNGYSRWYPDGSQSDINRIKSQIYEDGPLCTSFLATDDFGRWVSSHHSADDYYPFTYHTDQSNHCVILVGWKDDPSIGNGGYWIVKNSWGKYSGYDGFFNIEYGTLGIDNVQITSVDYDPESYDWAPRADTGGIYYGSTGETITFDASESFDAEDNIVSYHWDFGDGTTSSSCVTSHSYVDRGLYEVTLTVTDESGNSGSQETNALIDFWKPGDSWTYDITIDFDVQGMMTGNLHFSFDDFVLTVSDETTDDYILDFTGDLTGEFTSAVDVFEFGGKIPRSIPIEGSLHLNKQKLTINELSLRADGRISIGKSSSSLLKLPIPFEMNAEVSVDDGLEIIHLPLKEYKELDIGPKEMDITGEFSSFWFKFLNVINKLSGQSLLPPSIGELLPVIDFSEMFQDFSSRQYPYLCTYEGDRTVEAGTFDTYKIFVETAYTDSFGCNYYFTPEINNIVLIEAEFDEHVLSFVSFSGAIHAELQSYNFA
ncbi:MAG: C1 family peptidase [Thermoplasmatota archaeon]